MSRKMRYNLIKLDVIYIFLTYSGITKIITFRSNSTSEHKDSQAPCLGEGLDRNQRSFCTLEVQA